MKKFLLLLFFVSCFSYAQKTNNEFRSAWIITWEYINSSSSVAENKARIINILDNMKKANMTSVIWQVRQRGAAYYHSTYEPWGMQAGGVYPGFDPTQFALEEAHKRGMEFHAWFNTFSMVQNSQPGTPAYVYPEWVARDKNGNAMTSDIALSPGLSAVRDYTLNVAADLLRKYDVDGLHLDYVRWNEFENGSGNPYRYDVEHPFSAGVPAGYSTWEEFWRGSVTDLVRRMHDTVQAIRPYARLSAAALGNYNWGGWQGYGTVYQDAALWFNEGYIDQLTPMSYHWLDGPGFKDMLVNPTQSWGVSLQKGIAAGRLFSTGPGSYLMESVWGNHPGVVAYVRDVPWNDGFQFFSYGSWAKFNYFDEAGRTFFKKITKIRSTGLISKDVPVSPAISVNKIDSLTYDVSLTHASNEGHWFAVYRSESDVFNKDSSVIMAVLYDTASAVQRIKFNGNENFGGNFRIAVTALNRYWNESNFSNAVVIDPVPNLPVKVIAYTPANNATVKPNAPITVKFSKGVDTLNIKSKIHLSPSQNFNVKFANENTELTLLLDTLLLANTRYSVLLDSTITEMTGKMLDNDFNGIPDSYRWAFNVEKRDSLNPYIIGTLPLNGETNFDVDGAVSIQTNERMNTTTIGESTIKMRTEAGANIRIIIRTYNVNNKTIISFRPAASLTPNTNYIVDVLEGIKDSSGNPLEPMSINLKTSSYNYITKTLIDNLFNSTSWLQPRASASTVGTMVSTTMALTVDNYLPATTSPMSMQLNYEWNASVPTGRLIREYLNVGTTPKGVTFDTSVYVQAFVFGDSSGTLFRLAIEGGSNGTWDELEVSQWIPIDWMGWKIISWKINDPAQMGTWLGNGVLDRPLYRFDSFQLTSAAGSKNKGTIFFDDPRFAKRNFINSVFDEIINVNQFGLMQNYPNPFNPTTKIMFVIDKSGLTKLEVYNMLGEKVSTIVNEELNKGVYSFDFSGKGLASGQYIYRLTNNGNVQSKIMSFVK